MDEIPSLFELDIPSGFSSEEIIRAANRMIGSPLLIKRDTKEIGALIKSIVIQQNVFLCEVDVISEELKQNFHDYEYIYTNYEEIHSVMGAFYPFH